MWCSHPKSDCVRAQGKEDLHQVQAGTEQNGELFIGPVEPPTHDWRFC